MKLVHLESSSIGSDINREGLRQFGELVTYPDFDQGKTAEQIRDADIVLINKTVMDRHTLKNAENLKLICELATGYDNIDVACCAERGIAVANAGHYSTTAVVQHTFMLAFSLLGNMVYYDRFVKSGDYAASSSFTHFDAPVREIAGRTWGIVGMGDIGSHVARAAEVFGAHVIFFSPTGKSTCTEYERVEFDELLSRSDVISLHCPLTDLTRKLFGADAFSKMKKSAYLINVARGGVVDQRALADALLSGEIAGAGLDVLEAEPMRVDNPLSEIKDSGRLIITPHMAWASVEARQRDVDIACDNIRAFLAGERKNRVD
ncbi:MAG: D-2-hydroxyacid dehydrogenase [Lachnospiraceae bacterium]|nr:D-2-hydroxyacid dehydrogenase [Lachnospiraceae bacterium]